MKLNEIEMAFEFLSTGSQYESQVVYDKQKDCLYYASDYSGENEIPDNLDWDHCVNIPHKNDLDLGRHLVLKFVDQHLPNEHERVRGYFGKRGAYSRLKELLAVKGLLESWYEFEAEAQLQALVEWCNENGVPVDAETA